MKRLVIFPLMLLSLLAAQAGTMTLETGQPVGTSVRMLFNAASATEPISIDWGNGVEIKYTVDPAQMAYNRWISGTVEGSYIKVSGDITEATLSGLGFESALLQDMSKLQKLDLSKNSLASFRIIGDTPLTELNLSANRLVNSTTEDADLTLSNAGSTLKSLNIAGNSGLICLDMRHLTALQYFTANDCSGMGSVFICTPEESRPELLSINLSNCDIAHFYPINLPNLKVLNLSGNTLITDNDDEPFRLGNYPSLQTLDLSGNIAVKSLDLKVCPSLTTLNISGCKFDKLDLAALTALEVLNIENNNIRALDISKALQLRNINLAGNPIRNIDFSVYTAAQNIDISRTEISRAVIMNSPYLKSFRAAGSLIEFVDFNGQSAERMDVIDLRNCTAMTAETADYTIHTMPQGKERGGSSMLYLSGSNAEGADVSYATSSDMRWVCDIQGNASAKHESVAVTLVDATDTGVNVTGSLDRLYPTFGIGFDYDFDRYSTSGGEFLISQWQPQYYQTMKSVTDKALVGVPIHIYPYPAEGKRFKSVTVDGVEIFSQWFVVSKPCNIKVNFTAEQNTISFNTTPGTALSLLVNTIEDGASVFIDWGSGTRMEYPGQNSYAVGDTELGGKRIDATAAGEKVTIYGDIAALDVSGFGDVAEFFGLWDNKITAIDLSAAPNLAYLNAYYNPVSSVDIASCPNLVYLDLGYTNMKSIDLSHNPYLMWVDLHSDGFGDEGIIAQLSEVNVGKLELLQYLDVKGNLLKNLDLSGNPHLMWLFAGDNQLTSIDLSRQPELREVNLAKNKLTAFDASVATQLTSLSLESNNIKELKLPSHNALVSLNIGNNDIHSFDASALEELRTLYIHGNGMSAEELNDLYYLLPQRKEDLPDNSGGNKPAWNISVMQADDARPNDGNRADSSIPRERGWSPSHQGSNGGASTAYLDVLPSENGSVVIKDAAGNIYTHGSKVPKYTSLSIESTPAQGYHFAGYTLNGGALREGVAFDMPGIYTKFQPVFKEGTFVDSPSADAVYTVDGGIVLRGYFNADICSADGRRVASVTVSGEQRHALAPGVYIVRTPSGIKKLIVQ